MRPSTYPMLAAPNTSLTVSEILPVLPATSDTGAELMMTNSPFWICLKLALIFSNATFSESPLPAVVLTDSKGIAGSFLNGILIHYLASLE